MSQEKEREAFGLAELDDLLELHKRTSEGVWSQGMTSHHTVAKREGSPDYRIAEFHHADDASFVDAAHKYMPKLIELARAALASQQAGKGEPVAQVPDDDVAKAEWDGYQKGWQSAIGTLNKPATEQAQQEFTTGDNDLDALLNSAHWMREPGTGMDVGLTFIGALERIKARLAAAPEAPAQAEPDDCANTPYDEGPFTLAEPEPAQAALSAVEAGRDRKDAERWRTFIGLDYKIRAEWAANLSLVPVLTEWVDAALNQRKDKP